MDVNQQVNLKFIDPNCKFVLEPVSRATLVHKTKLESLTDVGKLLYSLTEGYISIGTGRLLGDILTYDRKAKKSDFNKVDKITEFVSKLSNETGLEDRVAFVLLHFHGLYETFIHDVYMHGVQMETFSKEHYIPKEECALIRENILLTLSDNYLNYIMLGSGPITHLLVVEDDRLPETIKNIFISKGIRTVGGIYNYFQFVVSKEEAIQKMNWGFSGEEKENGNVINSLITLGYIPKLKEKKITPSPIDLVGKTDN